MRVDLRALGVAASIAMMSSTAQAQEHGLMFASPIPDGAAQQFCYYEGLAYSLHAIVLVQVPFRRESPTATQARLLECVEADAGDTLVWRVTQQERTVGERGG